MIKRPRIRTSPHVLAVDERRVPMAIIDRNHTLLVLNSMAMNQNITLRDVIANADNRDKFKTLFTMRNYNNTQATYVWNRLHNKTLTLEELL